MKKDILILGVGNMLLGDEGVGVHVAQRLQQMSLPPEVEVVDGGTLGYELLSYVYGKRKVIILDALNADAKPGSVLRLLPEEIDMENPRSLFVHQSGLHELLHFAQQLQPLPEIILFGIVPKSLRCWTSKLSTPVEERMDTILQAIMEELTTSVPHLSPPVDQAERRG